MRKCQVTGKTITRGYSYSIRGIAKKKKGIGLKITGKTKRRFRPNLCTKRLWDPEGKKFITLKVSASGLRNIEKKGIATVMREMKAAGEKF